MLGPSENRRRPITRILVFRLAVFILFGILLLQLARLQIVRGEDYAERASNNSVLIIDLPAERGIITDRNGVPLVSNVPAYDAVAIPARIPDADRREIIFTLEGILDVPAERLNRLIDEGEEVAGFSPVVLKENLTRDQALTLRSMEPDLRGVTLEVAATRRYLSGELLAPIVGYIGPISAEQYGTEEYAQYGLSDRLGQTGIELEYEDYLRGDNGRRLIEQDAIGRQLRVLREEVPVPGNRVVLSLDYNLQTAASLALSTAMDQYSAPMGSAVVLDTRTGEVLALVSLPSYDANIFSAGITQRQYDDLDNLEVNPGRPLVNHAISDAFPPGSVFKVVTAAAALEFGSATPETRINSPGQMVVRNEFGAEDADQIFRDTFTGTADFSDGLAVSSNVYFYCLVAAQQPGSQFMEPGCPPELQGTGPGNLARMAAEFGLGQTTGIDLPNETPGLAPPGDADDPADPSDDVGNTNPGDGPLTNLSQWFGEISGYTPPEAWLLGNTLQFAIGQNVITTSPIQMATVVAAIANGGQLLEPRLLHEVMGPEGETVIPAHGADVSSNLPVAGENLAEIRQGMLDAVNAEYGTARAAAIPGVQIAGKTGSPQVDEIDPATGRQRTHAWFIGFGPFEDAEIAVAVYVQGGTGSEAAVPVAQAIFSTYFSQTAVGSVSP
ncbi:MAG: penicillin-binding protein 2 [Dehalococcoidia bacterium]|nr:penicillin-binding protein 2 [Dehalococcoidia bacterium]